MEMGGMKTGLALDTNHREWMEGGGGMAAYTILVWLIPWSLTPNFESGGRAFRLMRVDNVS
jgi:hypothetical protein